MFDVMIYEDGNAYEYYEDVYKSAIKLSIENYDDLVKIIDIVLKSGHSIEIRKRSIEFCKINTNNKININKKEE